MSSDTHDLELSSREIVRLLVLEIMKSLRSDAWFTWTCADVRIIDREVKWVENGLLPEDVWIIIIISYVDGNIELVATNGLFNGVRDSRYATIYNPNCIYEIFKLYYELGMKYEI